MYNNSLYFAYNIYIILYTCIYFKILNTAQARAWGAKAPHFSLENNFNKSRSLCTVHSLKYLMIYITK